jgi:indolepyruvate ferredoxin oxidoreductase
MGASTYHLSDRYSRDEGRVFLTGVQALARLPVEQLRVDFRAGLRTAAFVSGYPGSPLGGYDVEIARAARAAPELRIVCRPAVNEELAATAVMGSQLAQTQPDARYDGVLGVWYGKSPGVDRATDALRHAVFAGTSPRGGAIALVGDDPLAKSSTLPSSSAGVLADLHVPLLLPGDPAEALDLGRHAIALSRATGLWAALKIVSDVADGTASIELDPGRVAPVIPTLNGEPRARLPRGALLAPQSLELEREIFEIRYPLAIRYAAMNQLNRAVVDPADAWIGLVTSGITYFALREALSRLGLRTDAQIAAAGIRLLKMQMPIPFDPEAVRRCARGLEEVFVIEDKQPNLERLIKDALYSLADRPVVVGKDDEEARALLPGHGALDADALAPALRSRLARRLADRLAPLPPELPVAASALPLARSPFFCSGCPHNRSTEVPDDTLVGAGIGCHTMVLMMDEARVGRAAGLTAMGNEGAQWIGMSEFVERDHFVQNLGDGTFFHSGRLAIQAAVAAGVHATYKLLYNGAVAMTGGQHPQGQIGVPAVCRILLDQGVARVIVTTDDVAKYRRDPLPAGVEAWGRERIVEAQETLMRVSGVTVLIHDQPCAAEERRARKRGRLPAPSRRVVVNPRVCEGCGDCGRVSNCLSVQPVSTPFGRKTAIDQTTCNLDESCLEGDCPSFMTVALDPAARGTPDAPPSPVAAALRPALAGPPIEPTAPVATAPADGFAMRITGIGGTGVVTVAQVIGTAAMLDGFHVRGLDQIGLSQKAGPVVSDLRLTRGEPAGANRLGLGQADLLLALDALVAASETGMRVCSRERTRVVGSTSSTPTGAMVTHPTLAMPGPEELCARIASATRADLQVFADADEIVTDLFGDGLTANFFVVGMAHQAGCIPVSGDHLEEAIRLNGVAVEANLAAFRWGRCQVTAPGALADARAARRREIAAAPAAQPALRAPLAQRIDRIAGSDPALRALGERLAGELVAFQDVRCAAAYLDTLERVAEAERKVEPGSRQLTRTVAVHLFQLRAYKDEYEVARLLVHPDGLRAALELAGGKGRIRWLLHPPFLRALGLARKIAIPSWMAPLFRVLARGKLLRGTRFDPFGRTGIRRVERALPDEYVAAIDRVLARLSARSLGEAVRIAELPGSVRGYEALKLRRVREYRERLVRALDSFERDAERGAGREPGHPEETA